MSSSPYSPPRSDDRRGHGAVLDPKALFHSGMIVDDLDTTMKTLSDVAGYHWTSVMELDVTAVTPTGRQHARQRFVLSLEEPRLELVEAVPGTVWVSEGHNGVHHVGYWADADTIAETSATLARLGLPVEASNDAAADDALLWVYHRGLGGIRIELLSTLMKPSMDAWISGADPDAVQQNAPGEKDRNSR